MNLDRAQLAALSNHPGDRRETSTGTALWAALEPAGDRPAPGHPPPTGGQVVVYHAGEVVGVIGDAP